MIIAAAVWVVVSIVAVFKGIEQRRWRLFMPLMLGLLALPIDYFVKTDYEKVDIAVKTIFNSAIEATPEKIYPLISENYSDAGHKSKKYLMAFCKSHFSRPNIKKINKRYYNIKVDRPTAVCETKLVIILNPESPYAEYANIFTVEINFYFERTAKGNWQMTTSKIIEVNNHSASWKGVP